MFIAFSRVLWFLRLALLVAVVVGVTALVILDHRPGGGDMDSYVDLLSLYWLQILIPWDLALQVLVAVATAQKLRWAALRALLLGLLVDACIAVVFLAYLFFLR